MANDNKLVNLADLKVAFDDVNSRAGVTSVNGQTGAVSITPENIGAMEQKYGALTKEFINDPSTPYYYAGIFVNDLNSDNNIGIPVGSWFYVQHYAKDDRDGWAHQIFYEQGGMGRIYHRISTDSEGQQVWQNILEIPSKVPIDVTKGGTGATSPANARANLEITPANIGAVANTDIINITNGGTNAASASEAKINLAVHVHFDTASWSDVYTKLAQVTGGQSAFFWITDDTVAQFVAGTTTMAWSSGIVTNSGGTYRFYQLTADGNNGNGIIRYWEITNLTSTSGTVGPIKTMVTGIKGDAESTYRTGNVNLTPANIGAVAVGAETSDVTIQQSTALNLPVQIWSHGDLGRYVFSIAKDGGLYLYDEDLGRDIWSVPGGVLSVGNGGTGATNAASARANLEITPANIGAVANTDIINITNGGTNAASASEAKINLAVHVHFDTASWSDVYTKLAQVTGGQSAFFWITDDTVAQFVAGTTTMAWSSGIVTNSGGTYRFYQLTATGNNGNGIIRYWEITNLTSTSGTVGPIKTMVTGIKGDAESTYRTGNVNLTPANIGIGGLGAVVDNEVRNVSIEFQGNTKEVCHISLTAGTWIIIANLMITGATVGARQGATITTSNATGQFNYNAYELISINDTGNHYMNVSYIVTPTRTTTYYLMCYAETTRTVSGYIKAVRII